MNKIVFFGLLVILLILLFGCTQTTMCGDGICNGSEDSNSCPTDCGTIMQLPTETPPGDLQVPIGQPATDFSNKQPPSVSITTAASGQHNITVTSLQLAAQPTSNSASIKKPATNPMVITKTIPSIWVWSASFTRKNGWISDEKGWVWYNGDVWAYDFNKSAWMASNDFNKVFPVTGYYYLYKTFWYYIDQNWGYAQNLQYYKYPHCGDGYCDATENLRNCPQDCGTINLGVVTQTTKNIYSRGEQIGFTSLSKAMPVETNQEMPLPKATIEQISNIANQNTSKYMVEIIGGKIDLNKLFNPANIIQSISMAKSNTIQEITINGLKSSDTLVLSSGAVSKNNNNVILASLSQKYGGVPVYNGFVSLMTKNNISSIVKANLYDTSKISSTAPKISISQANAIAAQNCLVKTGSSYIGTTVHALSQVPISSLVRKFVACKAVLTPIKSELVYYPLPNGGLTMAYKVDMPFNYDNKTKVTYIIDASSGAILNAIDKVIYADSITGSIKGNIYPENPVKGSAIMPFSNEKVIIGGENVYSGPSGTFSVLKNPSNLDYSANLDGNFALVIYADGTPTPSIIGTIKTSSLDLDWNRMDTSYKKEASNSFYHVNKIHDFFTRGGAFNISAMNYQMKVFLSEDGVCNAYSTGPEIHFFKPGTLAGFGYCDATSLGSQILYHEYTHSVVAMVYDTVDLPYFSQSGAINEAWADYFAASLTNNPVMGEDIFPRPIRNLDNTMMYPKDYYVGFDDYGGVHINSPIYSGALWDLKKVKGKDFTDALVLNSIKLKPFDFSEGLKMMLAADDNDGTLLNGTPNIDSICNAFYDKHGIYTDECLGHTRGPIYFIKTPVLHQIFENGVVDVTGTVFGVSSWSLEVTGPNGYNTILASGSNSIINNKIASIQLAGLAGGDYDIKLYVNGRRDLYYETIFTYDTSGLGLKNWFMVNSFIVGDFLGNGNKEIAVNVSVNGTFNDRIYFLDKFGKKAAEPVDIGHRYYSLLRMYAADLDGDGKDEIAFLDDGTTQGLNYILDYPNVVFFKDSNVNGIPLTFKPVKSNQTTLIMSFSMQKNRDNNIDFTANYYSYSSAQKKILLVAQKVFKSTGIPVIPGVSYNLLEFVPLDLNSFVVFIPDYGSYQCAPESYLQGFFVNDSGGRMIYNLQGNPYIANPVLLDGNLYFINGLCPPNQKLFVFNPKYGNALSIIQNLNDKNIFIRSDWHSLTGGNIGGKTVLFGWGYTDRNRGIIKLVPSTQAAELIYGKGFSHPWPILVDVDGDGTKELVPKDLDNFRIAVINPITGVEKYSTRTADTQGWMEELIPFQISDLDSDGKASLVDISMGLMNQVSIKIAPLPFGPTTDNNSGTFGTDTKRDNTVPDLVLPLFSVIENQSNVKASCKLSASIQKNDSGNLKLAYQMINSAPIEIAANSKFDLGKMLNDYGVPFLGAGKYNAFISIDCGGEKTFNSNANFIVSE